MFAFFKSLHRLTYTSICFRFASNFFSYYFFSFLNSSNFSSWLSWNILSCCSSWVIIKLPWCAVLPILPISGDFAHIADNLCKRSLHFNLLFPPNHLAKWWAVRQMIWVDSPYQLFWSLLQAQISLCSYPQEVGRPHCR